ncbi:MAG: family 16 glycosylhydrolase [Micropruina sp.]|nr:family 16 glycosylhydrolase [Micropruina sp.]
MNYTTGFFASRDVGVHYPLFGRYEARLKVPQGQGLWPGFWLRHRLGSSTAEVDLMESFHATDSGTIRQSIHFPNTTGRNVAKTSVPIESAASGDGDWHIYAVDIRQLTPGDLTTMLFIFYMDGFETLRYTHTNAATITAGDLSAGWDIAFSYYLGGTYIGHPDRDLGYLPHLNGGVCAQTGAPPANGYPASCPTAGTWLAPWPSTQFQIDYVRVYQPT